MEPRRLLIVLYGGDYREAYRRMVAGEGETYHGHRYAIESIAKMAESLEDAAVLCCRSAEAYDERLDIGFRVIGTGFIPEDNMPKLLQIIEAFRPTHLVVRSPMLPVLKWAIRHRVETITLLADSFLGRGVRPWLRHRRLARALNHSQITWVGNHGRNACRSLQAIGVKPEKIIPWDWPYTLSPGDFPAKQGPQGREGQLLYVGTVSQAKGVGDLIEAVALLRQQAIPIHLNIAGNGTLDVFRQQVAQQQLQDQVTFLGRIPHSSIVPLMHESDVVVVPSRHCYPEGFPLTLYEALCARTPIVASDHPMFRGYLEHGQTAMIFPQKDSKALAHCIHKLLSYHELYQKLSWNAYEVWKRLQIPVKWAEFIERWLTPSEVNQAWLQAHSLTVNQDD